MDVDFGKKYDSPVSSILLKKIANNRENDHLSSLNWISRISYLIEWRMTIFAFIFAIFVCGIKKTRQFIFFPEIYVY